MTRAAAVLLLGVLLFGASADPSMLAAAVLVGVLGVGVLGAGLLAAGATALLLLGAVRPAPTTGPASAVAGHLRALARRGVPRLRDPDAAGHTRSRAPSGLLPAV